VVTSLLTTERRPVVLRRVWLIGMLTGTLAAFAATIALAPDGPEGPTKALLLVTFVGGAGHVATTAWFYTVPAVRAHARANSWRYIWIPVLLIVGTAAVAAALPAEHFVWLLYGYFGWQFFHFQKQNVGMAALAGVTTGAGSVTRAERNAIIVAGILGTAGLLVHPELIRLDGQLDVRYLFPLIGLAYSLTVGYGALVLFRGRELDRRPPLFVAVYLMSLLFFLPVFAFVEPFPAVAGLTLAHGYQYLLLLVLIAGAEKTGRLSLFSLPIVIELAILGGFALTAAQSTHFQEGVGITRAVYGAYLGVVMAHFVVDAGLWRLRDEFPRRFLGERIPYLLRPPS
jgi:hypothetical protein